MKKLLILSCLISTMYSCTSLEQLNINNQNRNNNVNVTKPKPIKELSQSTFYLTDSGVSYLLDMIAMDFSKGNVRNYDFSQIGMTLESYVGDKIVVNGIPGNRLEVVSTPKVQSYDFYLNNGTIVFKSLYQGEYIADVYNGLQYLGTVKILNKLKYKFTEADNYDIITRGYAAKDLKKVRDGISLYRISFPGSDKDKELSFMLMDLAASNGNTLLINEETKYLKDVYQLNEKDKIKLLQIQDKAFGKDLVIDNYFLTYDKSNVYLNSYIKEIILNKGIATDSELQFLEKMYMDSRDPQLAQEISELYLKNGNISKSTYYKGMASTGGIGLVGLGGLTNLSGIPDTSVAQPVSNNNIAPENTSNNLTTGNVNQFNKVFSDGKAALDKENYQEALVFLEKAKTLGNPQEQQTVKFYIGKTNYMLGQYDLAKQNLLGISEEDPNFPEAYYYLGVIAHREGNISKAKEYLMKVRETANNSTWGRKSSIYLMKL